MSQLKTIEKITSSKPAYIIAEVGSNWRDLKDCTDSILLAKNSGANAVKFQLYTHLGMYGIDGKLEGELPREWLPILRQKAEQCKIDFLCTAFSVDDLNYVDHFVLAHKIASSELTHTRMLERANAIGKPVFLSTGASSFEEIAYAMNILKDCDAIPLYCVIGYPAKEIDLRKITALNAIYGKAGYSDHSIDILHIPKAAVWDFGALVIEKHFTIIPDVKTPDQGHSLSPREFKRMVEAITYRTFDEPAQPIASWVKEEQAAVLRYRRRIIAIKDIKPGDQLKEGYNFGLYRSLKDDDRGAHGFQIDLIEGKWASKNIKSFDGISSLDFE